MEGMRGKGKVKEIRKIAKTKIMQKIITVV